MLALAGLFSWSVNFTEWRLYFSVAPRASLSSELFCGCLTHNRPGDNGGIWVETKGMWTWEELEGT